MAIRINGATNAQRSRPRGAYSTRLPIMPSTTLLVSQFDFFELEHPLQVVRLCHEEMRGEHFLDDGAHLWQCQQRLSASAPFLLKKTVGDGRQDDMALPSWQAAAFEVIESELVLELLVLLFDR